MQLLSINLMALLGFLWLGACTEDDKQDDMYAQGNNITLNVSGEVNGVYMARGQFLQHDDVVSGLYVNSFEFLDSFIPSQSNFLISITRFTEMPMKLGEDLHSVGNSYMVDGESDRFGAGVTWWDPDRNAIIYSDVENGFIRINRITQNRVSGEFSIQMKTSEYDEIQTEISIDGRFDVPRVEY